MKKETCMATILSLTLKEIRIEKGIKQSVIAEYLGMTTAGWGKLENAKTLLSVENMYCACSALEISPIQLLERVDKIINLLKTGGWEIRDKRTDYDGLIIGLGIPEAISKAVPFSGIPIVGALISTAVGMKAIKEGKEALNENAEKDTSNESAESKQAITPEQFGKVISKALIGYNFIEKTK